MTNVVDDLVARIQGDWCKHGFRTTAFPEVAGRALAESGLSGDAAKKALFDQVMGCELPVRKHPAPNLVSLYSGSRFTILLHLWNDGDAPLHHHAWAGAYQTISGTSIDATYSFHPVECVRRELLVGEISQRDVRRMQPGDARMVEPGPSFIHGFSYLSKTALTISVRTHELYDAETMDYYRPAIGIRLHTDRTAPDFIAERIRVLRFLCEADPKQHRERLAEMAAYSDPLVAFSALRHAQTTQLDDADLQAMCAAGERAHGAIFNLLLESARDLQSSQYLRQQRIQLPANEVSLRMLLSLLHVCVDRSALLTSTSELVDADEPVDWITSTALQMLARASEPAPPESLNGLDEILRTLVAGVSPASVPDALSEEFELDAVARQLVVDLVSELLRNPAFRLLRPQSVNRPSTKKD